MKWFDKDRVVIGTMVVIALVLRFLTNGKYGFHRDEFLYIAQGQHLDWGYWSNPPGPGFFSWLTQLSLGDSLFAMRFFPALLGGLTVLLVCLITKEMGGGRFAQILAGLSVVLANAMPRVFLMYNPVPFDVFYWTLAAYLIVKYLNSERPKYLLWLGVAIGAGMLNKYSMIFFVLAALLAVWLSKYRKVFRSRYFYYTGGISVLIVLPNLIWQWQYGFPILGHMSDLRETQLVNVNATEFMMDQLLFNSSVLLVWLPGLLYLFLNQKGKAFRPIGVVFLGIIGLLLVLKGKSYYTLGAYPMLFAAGAVAWEVWTKDRKWGRVIPIVIALGIFQFTLPISVPYLPLEKMVAFSDRMIAIGLDGLVRWEDGRTHELPQDYADMLGWEEMGNLVVEAVKRLEDPEKVLIYCENFGQAGAVAYYGSKQGIPQPVSFADSYLLWVPTEIDPTIEDFIYVNDEMGEDVQELFGEITVIGSVENTYARERGTTIYLCQKPQRPMADFWTGRVYEVKTGLNLPISDR